MTDKIYTVLSTSLGRPGGRYAASSEEDAARKAIMRRIPRQLSPSNSLDMTIQLLEKEKNNNSKKNVYEQKKKTQDRKPILFHASIVSDHQAAMDFDIKG